MAFDFLPIPAMSSECERVFSDTKHTISDDRCRLGAAIVEDIECEGALDASWARRHSWGTIQVSYRELKLSMSKPDYNAPH